MTEFCPSPVLGRSRPGDLMSDAHIGLLGDSWWGISGAVTLHWDYGQPVSQSVSE